MLNKLRQFGIAGERKAVTYMKKKGYKLVEQNFTCRFGEIDIIMSKDNTLVFVEVKRRSNRKFGLGYEAVDSVKIDRLRKSAMHYLQVNNIELLCRFDVVSLDKTENGEVVTHIENAF